MLTRFPVLVALTLTLSLVATPASAAPKRVQAATLLAQLTVDQERNRHTYMRSKFDHWVMKSGSCDTRETVMTKESKKKVTRTKACKVTSGRWRNEYNGKFITNPKRIEIDHRVALAEAWRSGAHAWTANRRRGFANDIRYMHTLVAVGSHSNRAKSDHDPARWLPAKGKCRYVARWVAVKYRWNLKVDPAEKRAIHKRLTACPKSATLVAKPAKGKAEKKTTGVSKKGSADSVPPTSAYHCPASHPIKGNANSMIYHLPGQRYYDVTNPEECFASESAARAAGYRAAKV